MKHAIRLTLMVGVAAGALMMVWGNWGYAQGTDPNAAPNPYKMQENWAQLTDGRKFGQAIKVQVDHSDGKSIWVFDRCSSNDCSNSMIPPIQKFDPGGKFVTAFGANMFNQPHGFYVDSQGNVWVADERAKNGKGAVVVKFSPRGQVLMTLGKPGTPGNAPGFLDGPSGVVVAPNGDIYVADGHGGRGEAPAEQCLDAGQDRPGRGDRQLLPGDLEQQGAVEVHRRQPGQPRPGVEVRPVVYEPRQHRVGVTQVRPRLLQPCGVIGILGHGLLPPPVLFLPPSSALTPKIEQLDAGERGQPVHQLVLERRVTVL